MARARRPRGLRSLVVAALALAPLLVVETGAAAGTDTPSTVPAVREALSLSPHSVVAHDNEVMALTPHAGRLFAATDQWMSPARSPHGQVLVKDHAGSPWRVFQDTQSLRVQALASFPIPPDQGLGAGHSVLVTQAIVAGTSRIEWLRDGADAFRAENSFALASKAAAARAFGAHEDGGVWSVYAGVAPTGVLRGTWSRSRHTFVFDPTPELRVAPAQNPGLRNQKVTAFSDCGAALYVTINTRLYRRNDGSLPTGAARWSPVYQAPPVGAFNSGLRGLSCIRYRGAPALLASTEGNGDILRFDGLASGTSPASALTPVTELAPIPAIRGMLAGSGTDVPSRGPTAVGYVIAAYNDFTPIPVPHGSGQAFGFEWGYASQCPAGRTCGPRAFGAVTFDAAACFFVRTDHDGQVSYAPHCLGGRDMTPSPPVTNPIRSGQAFVSIRTIRPSPFHDGRMYFGGYDCNFFPADGTAWVARVGHQAFARAVAS